jgi:lysozyme family protein
MPTFQSTERGYTNLWNSCIVKAPKMADLNKVVDRILANRNKYEAVEKATGVPWIWIACTHDRESSGSFAGVLHNGERIIGTGRKTKLVPRGRGPFSSWEEAAIDAIKLHDLHLIKNWSPARMLYEWERFNGFGYTARGVNSPYVWAMTNHQQPGKYVADKVWSSTEMDTQRGTAAIYKVYLMRTAGAEKPVDKPSVPQVPTPTIPEITHQRPSKSVWQTIWEAIVAYFNRGKKK